MQHLSKHAMAIALAFLWAAMPAAAEDDELGYVSSLAGSATAERPGEEPRPLACGDPVYADDVVRTGADSRVGVMLGDVAAHLAGDTQVSLGRTGGAMPAARLESGQVRVIDPREEAGAPAQLAVLDAEARVAGNDAEAYLFAEKVGPYAMLCEWDAPLEVSRGPEPPHVASPGECVVAKPTEPLYTAQAHDERLPAAPEEQCDFDVASGPLSRHLSPADVAAPGPVRGLSLQSLAFQGPGRSPCDAGGPACRLGLPVVAAPGGPVNPPNPGPPLGQP